MKILFIYPNAEGYGRMPLGIAILITILLEKEHQVELFDTTFLSKSENIDSVIREKANLVLPTDRSHLYQFHSFEEILEMLRKKVRNFLPDLIALSIVEDNYQYADKLISYIKQLGMNIPIVVGGTTPTIAPDVVMENPNIDFLIQGEGEEALIELCDRLARNESLNGLRNLWYRENGEIKNNPVRPFVDLDTLPTLNLDIWDEKHFFKPYCGKLYRSGFYEITRGCMHSCSYCVNKSYRKYLKEAGNFHRKRSINKTINEIKILSEKYNLEMIFFCDDNFLLSMTKDRIEEFVYLWKKDINLPYWINTAAESVDETKIGLLKETGVCGIGIGIESGSEWVRKNILKRNTPLNVIKNAFEIIHKFGIRTTANSMIGIPGELEEDIFETIKLNKIIKPNSLDLNFLAPYYGTEIHRVVSRLGYIEVEDRPGFRGMAKKITTRHESVINNPYISKEKLNELFFDFMDYVEGRKAIPDQFKNPAAGSYEGALTRREQGKEVLLSFDA
jgi:anaerobic magnesium-protoporphyrin IX monomethyl ester cyclase